MKVLIKGLTLCLVLSFAMSCENAPRSLAQYSNWFASLDNGYVKQKQVGKILYKVIYTPAEYLLSRQLAADQTYDVEAIEAKLSELKAGKNFILQVGLASGEASGGEELLAAKVKDYEGYKQLIDQLSFNFQEQASLITNGDTLAPSMYHFERGYELAKTQTFLFAFPVSDATDEMTFRFEDPLFETGVNKFRFSQLKTIPPLPINYNP